jgi:hypothetical protein
MHIDRQRLPPRERTFTELFPWRNLRRALMLVLLIVAILVIKRSTGGFLGRMGDLWGTTSAAAPGAPAPTPPGPAGDGVRVRLGPGLAPSAPVKVTP